MKILCLNTWGGKLFDVLLPYLQQSDADVICLQEVVHSPTTDEGWLTYKDGDHVLEQRANLFGDIAGVLPDYNATFCPASQGELWKNNTPFPSQWGIATFVRDSIPVIGQMQGFVHKRFAHNGYGDHPRSRNAHVLRLFDYESKETMTVAHMHGLRDLRGKMDTPERLQQANKLMSLVETTSGENEPLVVCGDFNIEPDSQTFEVLAKHGLRDLVTTRTSKGTRNSWYKKPGKFADYMFVNNRVNILEFTVDFDNEVSDHCPMILEIANR